MNQFHEEILNLGFKNSILGKMDQMGKNYYAYDIRDQLMTDRSRSLSTGLVYTNAYQNKGEKFGDFGLIDYGNVWTARNPVPLIKCHSTGSSVSSDLVFNSGGENNLTYTVLDVCDRLTNSQNVWTGRTAFTTARMCAAAINLTSDKFMISGGWTAGSTPSLYNHRYNVSANSWTYRQDNIYTLGYKGSFSLTSDTGMVLCGGSNTTNYTTSTEKYSESGNLWSVKQVTTYAKRCTSSITFSSILGISCNGYNGSAMPNNEAYYENLYAWINKTSDIAMWNCASLSLTSSTGLISSGSNSSGYLNYTRRYNINIDVFSAAAQHPMGHSAACGSSLTSSLGVTMGGTNATVLFDNCFSFNNGVAGSEYSNYGYSLSSSNLMPYSDTGTWTCVNADMTETKNSGTSFGLTSDYGIVVGGANGATSYSNVTERYSDSGIIWTTRGTSNYGRMASSSFTLTSSTGLEAAGNNGTTPYQVWTQRYDDSGGGTWTVRGSGSGLTAKYGAGSIKLTSDGGVVACGYNGSAYLKSNQKYSDATTVWTSKTDYTGNGRYYTSSLNFTSDTGMICGGGNATGAMSESYEYKDSDNIWTQRIYIPENKADSRGISTNDGMVVGGVKSYTVYVGQSHTYNNSQDIWYSKTAKLMYESSSYGFELNGNIGISSGGFNGSKLAKTFKWNSTTPISAPIPWDKYCGVPTVRLRDQKDPIYQVYASALYSKDPSLNDLTFGVSADDGKTWKDGFTLNTVVDISDLQPSKVESGKNVYSWPVRYEEGLPGTFQYRGTPIVPRAASGNFSLISTPFGIQASGNNGAVRANVERYNDINNTWTAVTVGSEPSARQYSFPFSLTSDTGVIAGGYTSTFVSLTDKYTNSTTSWLSRSSSVFTARQGGGSFFTSTNTGITAGGCNASMVYTTTQAFAEDVNTWSNKTSFTMGRWMNSMFGIINSTEKTDSCDLCILAAGNNGTSGADDYKVSNCDRFSVSANTWTSISSLPLTKDYNNSISLSSKCGLVTGGITFTGDLNQYNSYKYEHGTNTWKTFTKNSGAASAGGISGISIFSGYYTWKFSESTSNKYQLKVRFELPQAQEVWISKAYNPQVVWTGGSMGLTSDIGILSNGSNGVGSTWVKSFTDSTNIWGSRTQNVGRYHVRAAALNTNSGLSWSGTNGTGDVTTTEKYSLIPNTWIARSSSSGRWTMAEFSLTSDKIIAALGRLFAGTYHASTYLYTDSSNTWTDKSANATIARNEVSNFTFTSDLGVAAGGTNNNIQYVVDRYSLAANNWSARTNVPQAISASQGITLTSDKGIISGGADGSGGFACGFTYYYNSNVWSIGKPCDAAIWKGFYMNMNSTSGVFSGGALGATRKYITGEVNLVGFTISDFNGNKLV